MVRKIVIICVGLLFFAACENREPEPVVTPEWLETRIAELEADDCTGCSIKRYTYNEAYFYHVYCNYWSCYNCEIYYSDGTLVDWSQIDPYDFDTNKSEQIVLWKCEADSSEE